MQARILESDGALTSKAGSNWEDIPWGGHAQVQDTWHEIMTWHGLTT